MHPTDLRWTLHNTLHLLSYAAPLLIYLSIYKFYTMSDYSASGQFGTRMKRSAGTGTIPVPE